MSGFVIFDNIAIFNADVAIANQYNGLPIKSKDISNKDANPYTDNLIDYKRHPNPIDNRIYTYIDSDKWPEYLSDNYNYVDLNYLAEQGWLFQ